jgi:hypothetical protein
MSNANQVSLATFEREVLESSIYGMFIASSYVSCRKPHSSATKILVGVMRDCLWSQLMASPKSGFITTLRVTRLCRLQSSALERLRTRKHVLNLTRI